MTTSAVNRRAALTAVAAAVPLAPVAALASKSADAELRYLLLRYREQASAYDTALAAWRAAHEAACTAPPIAYRDKSEWIASVFHYNDLGRACDAAHAAMRETRADIFRLLG
jgi:hypothetical protein